ncbi:MAG: DUF5017 domain-containing protein [Pedobacter sp.]|uniref:DUF5017 domain-containing protein n=1 Tax=Pedobacter sp. TaxID=1411316 RepID=UPI00356670DB
MKNIRFCVLVLFAGSYLSACNKVEVEAPSFDVQVSSATYKVGQEVNFNFTGDADQITFFSGEMLNDYNFKDGRKENIKSVTAEFATNVQYGTQPDLLSVWVSTDFSGIYSYNEVTKATWKNEVTKNYKFAPQSQNTSAVASAVNSGKLDLISEFEEGKPLYIAFRYKKKPDAEAGTQRNWFIRNIDVSTITDVTENPKPLFGGTGFKIVYDYNFPDIFTDPSLLNTAIHNSSVNPTSGLITLRVPNSLGTVNSEVWAISPAMTLGSSIDLGPDRGIPVKGFKNLKSENFSHIYLEEGTYTATFVASNSNTYGEQKVVKQVTITITP